MSQPTFILGGYQTDFARNFTREGRDFGDLTAEVVDHTLTASRVSGPLGATRRLPARTAPASASAHRFACPATPGRPVPLVTRPL